jgi:Protein of unknown function (DUF3365)
MRINTVDACAPATQVSPCEPLSPLGRPRQGLDPSGSRRRDRVSDSRRGALLRLRQSKGQETVHEFTEIGGQRVVRCAQARVMKRACVECHNTHPQSRRKDWKEGDVRGVLVIIRPLGEDEARVGEALRLALLLSAVVSGLRVGGGHARGVGRTPAPPAGVVKAGRPRRSRLALPTRAAHLRAAVRPTEGNLARDVERTGPIDRGIRRHRRCRDPGCRPRGVCTAGCRPPS